MAFRVLRLLEYVYEFGEAMSEDMARWTANYKTHSMTMRSTSLYPEFVDGDVSYESRIVDAIKNPPSDEPLLGLATTRQLLEEVASRMAFTQNSIKGRELGSMCQEALVNLGPGILTYRTVDAT